MTVLPGGLLALSFLLAGAGVQPAPPTDTIEITELLKLRKRPTTRARQIGLLLQSERVDVVKRRGLWFRVRSRYGEGWVHGDYVREGWPATPWKARARVDLPAPARVDEGVSLRSRPSVESPRRAILPRGALLIVDRVDGSWLGVGSSAGEGWVHSDSIVAVDPPRPPSPPVEQTAHFEFRVVPEIDAKAPSLPFVGGYRRPLLAVLLPSTDREVTVRALEGEAGELWLPLDSLVELRLDARRLTPVEIEGERYVELGRVDGLGYAFDPTNQRLLFDLDPALLRTTRLDIRPSRYMPPRRSRLGAVLNYDLVATRGNAAQTGISGQFDARVFGPLGSLQNLMVASDAEGARGLVRLLTTWRLDRPEKMRTLLVGDSTTPSGLWWRSAQLAGVQWRSNFSTQPGFLPYPQPTVSGEAVWPSEIEIYLGEALRERRVVPAGPFEINNIPVVTGQGDFTYVVRDALGREIATTQSFYSEPTLLKPGLSEFSFTVGALRARLGEANFDYGDAVGVGSYRRGLSDRLTLESHAELRDRSGTLGAGLSAMLPRVGALQLGVAAGRGPGESGTLLSYGYSYHGRGFSLAIAGEAAERGFQRLGEVAGQRTRRALRGRIGQSIRGGATVSMVYASRSREGGDRIETRGLHLSARMSNRLIFQVSGLETIGVQRDRYATFVLTRLIGKTSSASVSSTLQGGAHLRSGARYQRATPFGPGFGFSLAAEAGESDRLQGSLGVRTALGDLRMDSSAGDDGLSLRPAWSGAVVALGGGVYLSRTIADSFGLAQTGVPNVRVYHENRLVGRSDNKGRLLVPGLLPYQPNKLRAELEDLPMEALAGDLELEVSPFAGSGLLVEFPIDLRKSALVQLETAAGARVPAGAVATDVANGAAFPVALDGQVYLTGLDGRRRYEVRWPAHECAFEFDPAVGIGHLERVVCAEAAN